MAVQAQATRATEPPREARGRPAVARPIELKSAHSIRFMAPLGISMLWHDKLKLAGTLVGVAFAVLMSCFQTALFLGLLLRNTMYVDRVEADIWITPKNTQILEGGDGTIPKSIVEVARSVKGVSWSAPLLVGNAGLKLPMGGQKGVRLVGTELPAARGGPFHIVVGKTKDLAQPDAMFFEDSRRESFGGLNIGSVREVNGHRVVAVGFTVGLIPFGPPYAFSSFDMAREILHIPNDEVSYVMLGLAPGADANEVVRRLQKTFPDQLVMSREDIRGRIIGYILKESGVGGSTAMAVIMAVFCGFAIVSLTMFSAVVDHVREFGTLKAIGATNFDLAKLLLAQAVTCAIAGTILGVALAAQMVAKARGPELPVALPVWLIGVSMVGMILICVTASMVALLRVRAIEPAMVFR
jgi:putative ABC transport system permease protein